MPRVETRSRKPPISEKQRHQQNTSLRPPHRQARAQVVSKSPPRNTHAVHRRVSPGPSWVPGTGADCRYARGRGRGLPVHFPLAAPRAGRTWMKSSSESNASSMAAMVPLPRLRRLKGDARGPPPGQPLGRVSPRRRAEARGMLGRAAAAKWPTPAAGPMSRWRKMTSSGPQLFGIVSRT
eukprot:363781-Chlamydomonas_euryale.AAC.21